MRGALVYVATPDRCAGWAGGCGLAGWGLGGAWAALVGRRGLEWGGEGRIVGQGAVQKAWRAGLRWAGTVPGHE